ncbi:g5842 [Coccomyxa viridis]|uniref:G5842 protein n=1 Tax=Coccomyxa viridis TaxID=1274662 RepID=A0ABP1FTX3_9CHLO
MTSSGLLLPSSSTRQIHAFNPQARAGFLRCRHRRSYASQCIQRSVENVSEGTGNKGDSTQLSFQRREALLSTSALTAALFLSDLSSLPATAADIKTVFVAGASGSTGIRVVRELRKRGFTVRAAVRDVEKAREKGVQVDGGVELVTADVTQGADSLAAAMGNADAVISAIGGSGDANTYHAVDNEGNVALVDAALKKNIRKFVLMSSLLTNGKEAGQSLNPGYIFLNLFGNVLNEKLVSEKYLRASGLDYTIVRPGGLKKTPPSEVGNLVTGKEDTLFGLPTQRGKDISRDTVAEVLVEALRQPGASNKVVEVVAAKDEPERPSSEWFSNL